MLKRRIITAVALAALMMLGNIGTAFADHTHVRVLGNGKCVVLAANGGEKYVQLPNADDFPDNRKHPLHVNVHLGKPGTVKGEEVIFVKGSEGDLANCTTYVNG